MPRLREVCQCPDNGWKGQFRPRNILPVDQFNLLTFRPDAITAEQSRAKHDLDLTDAWHGIDGQ